MKKLIFFTLLMIGVFAVQAQTTLPKNPEPGKCYVECVTPDEYRTETVKVLVRPEYKRLKVIPAEYKTVYDTVIVKEASVRYEYVPAEYETVTVEYQKEDGYNKLNVSPASFGSGSEEVEVSPRTVRYEWQVYENCESDNPGDCRVLCAVEYPAQTTSVPTKPLEQDARTEKRPINGEKANYTKRVVKKKAEVREIPIPAETKVVARRVLVKDETVEEEIVPAEYQEVEKQVLVKAGGVTIWEEIDCELLSYTILPINYELGSARLTPRARQIIDDKLVSLMQDRPNIRIEIAAHTDSRGSKASNQSLSERRARSVVNYLVSKGISRSRLESKGYGENRLKNRCADGVDCTEAEHAINRRTEFRVLN